MVTGGESRIHGLAAAFKNENGVTQVIPPCGRCREFIRQTNKHNLEIDVILGEDKVVKLKELLPHYDWLGEPETGRDDPDGTDK